MGISCALHWRVGWSSVVLIQFPFISPLLLGALHSEDSYGHSLTQIIV